MAGMCGDGVKPDSFFFCAMGDEWVVRGRGGRAEQKLAAVIIRGEVGVTGKCPGDDSEATMSTLSRRGVVNERLLYITGFCGIKRLGAECLVKGYQVMRG